MKVLNFRHVGIPVEDLAQGIEQFRPLGFELWEKGHDVINGAHVEWAKLINTDGATIELIVGSSNHLSFTVDAVCPDHYYFMAPSGHKIQYGFSAGVLIEYVEEPEK